MAVTITTTTDNMYVMVSSATITEVFQELEDQKVPSYQIVSHVVSGANHIVTYSKKNTNRS